MKLKKLIERLSKLDPNMDIIGFDYNRERLTKAINANVYQHDGREFSCHSGDEVNSDIPSGIYLLINFGD